MIITNTLLAGGAAYAYLKQRRNTPPDNLITRTGTDLQKKTEDARHYAAMSTLSVGLSTAGLITAAPITLLSIPINIYTNLPIFQEAIATLGGKDERLGSILWSLLISGTLASNHLFTASIFDWISQRSRLTGAKLRQNGAITSHVFAESVQQWLGQLIGRKPDSVWVLQDELEVEIPYADLKIGDIALFRKGDFISVTGVITKGEAELFDWSLLQTPPIVRTVDETVTPRMMVLEGFLYVEVENLL